MTTPISLYKGKTLKHQTLPLWEGDLVTELPTMSGEPKLTWKGSPIPRALFSQMIGFFRYVYTKWKSEAQLRLAYNADTGTWALLCYPQKVGTGMVSNELNCTTSKEKALRARAQELLQDGFSECGSTHSHCDSSAFQSSVDERDELGSMGIHITLGHITKEAIDVHGRVTFRGVQYPVHWRSWVEGWPEGVNDRCDKFTLQPESNLSFPPEWLDFCVDEAKARKVRPTRIGYSTGHYSSYSTGHNSVYPGAHGMQRTPPPGYGTADRVEHRKLWLKMGDPIARAVFIARNRHSFWRAPYGSGFIDDDVLALLMATCVSEDTWEEVANEITLFPNTPSATMQSLEPGLISVYRRLTDTPAVPSEFKLPDNYLPIMLEIAGMSPEERSDVLENACQGPMGSIDAEVQAELDEIDELERDRIDELTEQEELSEFYGFNVHGL